MSGNLGKQDLLAALKKASKEYSKLKIPTSYRSLIRLEQAGVIPKSKNPLVFESGRTWRVYSQEEINTIVRKIIEYKSKIMRDA